MSIDNAVDKWYNPSEGDNVIMDRIEQLLKEILNEIIDFTKSFGWRLVLAIFVLIVGLKLAKTVARQMEKRKNKSRLDKNLGAFLRSLVQILLSAAVLIGSLLILGVPAASFVTAIASCGLAIGLALQGSLSNFAGGIMLLIFKPFEIGDYIEGSGYSGTVVDISILYTQIITADNLKVSLPNGKLADNAVVNYTALGKRRVDVAVSVPYESDLKFVRTVLNGVVENNSYRIQDDPTTVEIGEYGSSGITMQVRYYASIDNYWSAVYKTRQDILDAFAENGITIPYDRIDIGRIENENAD